MNVTEKQKQLMINFMRSHPDFGRGRLRYNRENKKIVDELWSELTRVLNCSGSGPQKLPKAWAKCWRDWKSNLLKKVATYNSYEAGTGGGAPKSMDTSPAEEDLLDFLKPEAAEMIVPEGGAFSESSCPFNSPTTMPLETMGEPFSHKRNVEEHSCHSNIKMDIKYEIVDPNIENLQTYAPPNQKQDTNVGMLSKRKKRIYSEDEEFHILKPSTTTASSNKKIKQESRNDKIENMENVKQIYEQHSIDNLNIQYDMLILKKEEVALAREKLEFKKQSHAEITELMKALIGEVKNLTNVIQSFAPEYV